MNIKNIAFSLLAILPFTALAQQKIVSLTGHLSQAMNGQKITVMYGGLKKFTLDSAKVQNGKVQFQLKDAEAQVITVSTGKEVPLDNIRIYIADGAVSFRTKDSLKNAQISGHPHSVDYHRMHHPVDRMTSKRYAILRQVGTLSPEQKKGKEGEQLNAKMQAIYKQERALTLKSIDENPNSYIALMLLKNLASGTISYDEMMPHFKGLSKELRSSAEGKALEEKILLVKNLRSGQEANDFESLTPDGKTLKLSEIYPKSKYTFVDFWASWCAPCRAENPNVVKAYKAYKDKGLTILSVSLDTKANLWKEAIKKDGMPWLHVSQLKGFDEPAAVLYGIKMIPQNVLIDAEGKIVATNLRGYALEDKLKELMD